MLPNKNKLLLGNFGQRKKLGYKKITPNFFTSLLHVLNLIYTEDFLICIFYMYMCVCVCVCVCICMCLCVYI